jgi:hypothetical protein
MSEVAPMSYAKEVFGPKKLQRAETVMFLMRAQLKAGDRIEVMTSDRRIQLRSRFWRVTLSLSPHGSTFATGRFIRRTWRCPRR